MSENVATLERSATPQSSSHEKVPTPPAPFTEAEMQVFHAEDRHAGAAVACIMFAIFVVALIAYTSICVWVMGEV
jgi:hypothetical protein